MSALTRLKNRNFFKWLTLVLIAAALLLSGSGICIRHLSEVPPLWLVLSWILVFLWLFILVRLKLFSSPSSMTILVGTIVGWSLLAQSTGGDQSPLTYGILLLMGVAAWEGEARYAFGVAILYSVLEAVSLRHEDLSQGLPQYLRWGTFLISAIFLSRIVKTREEKERLNQRLTTLQTEAENLANSEEMPSFKIPKDKLLVEENRLNARVGTVIELEESLSRQLLLFQKTMGFYTAACFLLTDIEEKTVLRLRGHSSQSGSIAPDVTILPGETLIGLSAKEGRRVLLSPIAPESAKALPYYLKPPPITSFLAQPIFLKEDQSLSNAPAESEMVGVLVLDHQDPRYFDETRLELVDQFCRLLAETVQGTRVMHFSRMKTRNLHALFEVSNSFTSLSDIKMVLETALKTAAQITQCDSAYIALLQGKENVFDIIAWRGSVYATEKPRLEEELATWILENKKPIRYTRGQKEKKIIEFSRKEGMLGSTQSFLMVPLLVGENILGVIRLNSKKSDAYQEYDQDVMTTLANQTAITLENAMMVQQMQAMAERDGLTGVYNHRYFQQKLSEELTKAERYNKDLSLIMLDVDHFKKFNDTYGHMEGDKVLRTVAEVIQATVRNKVDVVARYGGEEFVIILPEADGNVGKELAERVRKNIEAYLFENSSKGIYRVTVSLGVASYPFDAREQRTLIQNADLALYQAKNGGRNRVSKFQAN